MTAVEHSGAHYAMAALEAALGVLDGASYVVDRDAAILHANDAGRSLVRTRGAASVQQLLATALHGGLPSCRVEPVPGHDHFLVVVRPDADEVGRRRIVQAMARWKLSARKAAVLERVVSGLRNADIAKELGISQRTVEVHVTALFERAGVSNRSELVAATLSG